MYLSQLCPGHADDGADGHREQGQRVPVRPAAIPLPDLWGWDRLGAWDIPQNPPLPPVLTLRP